MKYALIGCGRISPNHIEASKNNHLDFVAMSDIIPDAMKEKSDRFGLDNVILINEIGCQTYAASGFSLS